MEYLSRQWSVPTNENGLALAAVDFGGKQRNWARSESEWSPRAQSRSRHQPRDREGSLGEVKVGCGAQCVQRHLQRRPQGNIIITINFIMF